MTRKRMLGSTAAVIALVGASLTGIVAAGAAKPAPPPPPTTNVTFSGRSWTIKTSPGKVGPGPNVFAAPNATVDASGRLHLAITRQGKTWSCAEVVLDQSLGYGTYEWTLGTDVSNIDRNVVLGLFTWNDAPDDNHREIDFEAARWGNASDPTNAQWVVQPYDTTGNLRRWTIGSGTPVIIRFTWSPSSVSFQALAGSTVVEQWTYAGRDVPLPGGEHARMNLWLYQGRAPSNGQPVDVVLDAFSYRPLGR